MSLSNRMFKGALWTAADRFSTQILQFVLGIILARILSPTEYGTYSILLVFTAISQVFINSGFAAALIHKQDRNQNDISTVFVFNTIVSILCYIMIWFASPFIAEFYKIVELESLIKALGVTLVINAMFVVPSTLLRIKLDFKSFTIINFIANLFAGTIAIYYAYNGYGVWSLIIQAIVRSIITLFLTWYLAKWLPKWIFHKDSFKTLFKYGSNLLVSSLLNRVVSDFSSLYIGKLLSAQSLGYYNRGTQFSDFAFVSLNSILTGVLFPGLATVQHNRVLLTSHLKKIIKLASFITVPVFFGLATLAKPLVLFLLTDKWIDAVPIMQIMCIGRLITIVCGINTSMLTIIGRTDLLLRQQYLALSIRIIGIVLAIKYGIIWVAISEVTSTAIHFFINSYFPGKLLSYGAYEQIKDNFKFYINGIIMTIIVYVIIVMINENIFKLIIGSITGTLIYILLSKWNSKDEIAFIRIKVLGLLKK